MKVYEYPRSRSFTDLCSRSLRFHQFQTFLSNPMGLIKAKFHVEHPWEREAKVCSNGPGHMSKMATMPIYGRTLIQSCPGMPTSVMQFQANIIQFCHFSMILRQEFTSLSFHNTLKKKQLISSFNDSKIFGFLPFIDFFSIEISIYFIESIKEK